MKCPACFNELRQRDFAGVTLDVCEGGCGGVWFDAFELQKVDEAAETGGEPPLDVQRDEQVVVDFARKRECPRCADVKLKRHFFSARRQVQVDQCPNCGGYWLDAGELAQIQAEKATESLEQSGRKNISMEVIRYLYRLRTEGRDAS